MTFPKKFILFALVGGFSAGVNFFARLALSQITTYEVAIVVAFPIAMTTAFLLNRLFVFKQDFRHTWGHQYLRFFAVNIVALVQVFAVSVGLARWFFPLIGMTFQPESVAHAIGLLSPILTSYWLHQRVSFVGGAAPSSDQPPQRAADAEAKFHVRNPG